MLSTFLAQKQTRLFHVYDADNSGSLERQDFEALAERLLSIRKIAANATQRKKYTTPLRTMWETLATLAGKRGDERISLQEYLAARERLYADGSGYAAKSRSIAESMFGIMDQNGDGQISQREYLQHSEAAGMSAPDATEAWKKLDVSGRGHLTRDEFFARVHEFHFSEDPAAPGNWLFGKL